jgi:hypothetical protein
MIAASASWESASSLTERGQSGSSDVASFLDRELRKLLEHYAAPRMEVLIAEREELVADPSAKGSMKLGVVPIDEDAARTAIEFAFSLPRSMPAPEIAPDADGEICFDWFGPKQKMFSVSINKAGRIAFAGRFSEKSKIHGIEQLSEACPPEIIRGIAKATR